MQCTSPITLFNKGTRQEVPCGQCTLCRLCRARDWSTRILHEAAYWKGSSFATLTYRDDALPDDGGLDVEELQRYHKRLRKSLGKRRIRYYACGEYGERTKRPHYHVIYFGLSPCTCETRPDQRCTCPDRNLIMDAWPNGGVDRLGSVTWQSARYVADYVGKLKTGPLGLEEYGERQPPFALMSHGLGARFVEDHQHQLREQMKVTVNGVPVGLPRYYMHKLGLEAEDVDPSSVVPSKRRYRWHGHMPASVVDVEPIRAQRDKDARGKLALSVKDFEGPPLKVPPEACVSETSGVHDLRSGG